MSTSSSSLLSYYFLLNIFFVHLLIEKNFLILARELSIERQVIDVKSLLPSSTCSMPNKSTRPSRLNVVHRHDPCSPWARSDMQSLVEFLRQDQARVDYIHRRAANAITNLSDSSLFASVPTIVGLPFGTGLYIVTIGLGTPPTTLTVGFDTGSDLTWTQCVPCVNCYAQKEPFYDQAKSSTFADISCNSNYCTQLRKFGCSSTSTCLYEETFADKTITNGSFVQDVLLFSSDNIYNFRFGCGHDNRGETFGQEAGLLGLGRGVNSIISQTFQLYGRIFSYCLPSNFGEVGYLQLGGPISSVSYTQMLTHPSFPSLYFIKLIAISIKGTRIPFSPAGTMLDSGTFYSRVPPTTYSTLRSNFQKEMADYPTAPPLFDLDTCYNLTNYPNVEIPSISLIFEGEVMANLHVSGTVYVNTLSQVCLAFIQSNDDSDIMIIGNMQQHKLKVVYDVENSQIGFGTWDC